MISEEGGGSEHPLAPHTQRTTRRVPGRDGAHTGKIASS